jgi:hypothetical protein
MSCITMHESVPSYSSRTRVAPSGTSRALDLECGQPLAAQLAASGNPVWVVHAEKGDGGLTDAERATLQAAPNVTLVTIPGSVFLLPDEGSAEDRRTDQKRFIASVLTVDTLSSSMVDKRRNDSVFSGAQLAA